MTAASRRRWEDGDRLEGVADASGCAQGIEELAELARRPGWVAEEPEVHLVPHLRDVNIAGLQMLGCQTAQDGVLAFSATYMPDTSRHDIRQRAWALLGLIAEPVASVSEHADGDVVVFEVVTGIPDGPGPFAKRCFSRAYECSSRISRMTKFRRMRRFGRVGHPGGRGSPSPLQVGELLAEAILEQIVVVEGRLEAQGKDNYFSLTRYGKERPADQQGCRQLRPIS